MKIIDQRGAVYFRKQMGKLVSNASDAASLHHESAQAFSPAALHQNAVATAREVGLDPATRQGQAAAGAALISSTIAAALAHYERKNGKPPPRHVVQALEARFVQLLQGNKSQAQASTQAPTSVLTEEELQAFPRIQQPSRGKLQSLRPQDPPHSGGS